MIVHPHITLGERITIAVCIVLAISGSFLLAATASLIGIGALVFP
jgi:hypothetical protein